MHVSDDLVDIITGPTLPPHLYFHVPFCAEKCLYCDFASVAGADPVTVAQAFRVMRSQVTEWENTGLPGVVETVYFGGGTPSLHEAEVCELLEYVRERMVLHAACEVTVECNPDSLDEHAARAFVRAGATRLSVGVQSFDNSMLAWLGRRHDSRAAMDACRAVCAAGADLSVDLMCGVPGQTDASWRNTVHTACELGAVHVSVYPLAVEPNTPLESLVASGLREVGDPDDAADAMSVAQAILAEHGLERYEVANYALVAKPRSRHNTAYWTGKSYIGIGPGAHGMLDAETATFMGMLDRHSPGIARLRYANTADVDEWLLRGAVSIECLTDSEAAREDLMLGMRMTEGVTEELVMRADGVQVMQRLVANGLVMHERGRYRVTERGWLLGNEVFAAIWSPDS